MCVRKKQHTFLPSSCTAVGRGLGREKLFFNRFFHLPPTVRPHHRHPKRLRCCCLPTRLAKEEYPQTAATTTAATASTPLGTRLTHTESVKRTGFAHAHQRNKGRNAQQQQQCMHTHTHGRAQKRCARCDDCVRTFAVAAIFRRGV